MLILLPPSEGKISPESGEKLDLAALSFSADLSEVRAARIPGDIDLTKCRPASEIYSGVLYKALDWGGLPKAAQKRGLKSVAIISSLFGAIRMSDVIPSYKVKMKTSSWKSGVTAALEKLSSELIIDCRSSTYAGVWQPDPRKTVAIRVFKVVGRNRVVITHMSKKYRGELTRHLLLEPIPPRSPLELELIVARYFECELVENQGHSPWYLDLLIPGE